MSLDKSLKSKGGLQRHRNVLTRAERIEKLREQGLWTDDNGPIGLPKVAHRKTTAGAKEKKEKAPVAEEEGTSASSE